MKLIRIQTKYISNHEYTNKIMMWLKKESTVLYLSVYGVSHDMTAMSNYNALKYDPLQLVLPSAKMCQVASFFFLSFFYCS